MAEKNLKTRIMQKSDTDEAWRTVASTFTPKKGEVIIYLNCADTETSTNYITGNTKFKIGDGTTTLENLPFQEGQIIELSSITGTLSVEDYNNIIKSSCSKIKYASRLYHLQSEASDSITYVSNNGSVGYYITITKSTRAITGGSSSSLPITGGTLTGDLRLKDSTNYGRSLLFGDGSYAYIKEDTDDHLTVYGNKGVTLSTTSTYPVKVTGGSSPLESANGFKKTDFDNTYVLLAGGGAKALSDISSGSGGSTTILSNGTSLYLHSVFVVGSGILAQFSFYSDKATSYTNNLSGFITDCAAISNFEITEGSVTKSSASYPIIGVDFGTATSGKLTITYYTGSASATFTATSITDKVAKMASIGGDVTDVTFGGTATLLTVTDSNLSLVDGLHIRGKMPAAGTPSCIQLNAGTAHYVRTQTNTALGRSIAGSAVVEFVYNSSLTANSTAGVWQIWGVDGYADSDTNTKVTSVSNHYIPSTNSSYEISKDASSTTAATWGSTSLVTGVNLQRDAAGHVTGMTLDSIQMPAKPETGATVEQTNGIYRYASTLELAGAAPYASGSVVYPEGCSYREGQLLIDSQGTVAYCNSNVEATTIFSPKAKSYVTSLDGKTGAITLGYGLSMSVDNVLRSTVSLSDQLYTFGSTIENLGSATIDTSSPNLQDKQITGLWFHVGAGSDQTGPYSYRISLTDILARYTFIGDGNNLSENWVFNSGHYEFAFNISAISQEYSNGTLNYIFDIDVVTLNHKYNYFTPYVRFGFTYRGNDHAGSSMY